MARLTNKVARGIPLGELMQHFSEKLFSISYHNFVISNYFSGVHP